MGVLLHHGFFEAFFGESKDGSSVAKFSSGDTIFLTGMASTPRDVADLSYACLALHRSFFAKTDGLSAGVLLRCNDQPVVAALMVWKSLHACYSWLLRSDYRNTILPYFSHLSQDSQFDVFKVVYVNRDEILNVRPFPPQTIGDREAKHARPPHLSNKALGFLPEAAEIDMPLPFTKRRLVRAGALPPDQSSTTLAADHPRRIPRFYPSDRAPTLHRGNRGRASAHGPEPGSAYSADTEADRVYWASTRFPTNIFGARKNARLGTQVRSITRNLTTLSQPRRSPQQR
ncbi:hypothetical protein BHM03_00007341 [Ensete ventricosum]|nr:hypothetical protein BHM03_00007341 [Ensete ventricosum]